MQVTEENTNPKETGIGAQARRLTIAQYLKPYRARIAIGALLLLVTNGVEKSIPWMLQHAVDALHEGRLSTLRDWALGVLGTALGMWAVRTYSRVWVFNVGRDVEYDLRNDLLRKLHRLGPSFFAKMSPGELMSRATSDLGQVRLLAGFGLLNVCNSLYAYVMVLALMLSISPELTALALIPYPLFVIFARFFSRSLYRRSTEAQQALAALATRAQENLSAVRIVRSYGLEAAEEARFEEANQAALRANMRLVIIRSSMWPVLLGVSSIGTLIVIWQGGSMVIDEQLTVGQLTAFLAYLGQLTWPTMAFGWLLSVLQRGRAGFNRVREILETEPAVSDAAGAELAPGEGAIETRDLSFSYGDREVLSDVSVSVPAGGSLAVVGPTGSGKSTFAALLPRLLPTPEGSVFLDGKDVTSLQTQSLRKEVGYAKQEPFLFSTTVARNIGFSLAASSDMERIRHAAEEAAILDEIELLPDGFDTVVGERGVQLSGGQKQRIALARALLNEPAVIILDDPLSAVDAKTEAAILKALDRAGEGRSLILITHRIAAARRAKQIVVLDAGRIVERGSHEELCAQGGIYAKLAERQQAERELSAL